MRYPALDRLLVVQANILKVGLGVEGMIGGGGGEGGEDGARIGLTGPTE